MIKYNTRNLSLNHKTLKIFYVEMYIGKQMNTSKMMKYLKKNMNTCIVVAFLLLVVGVAYYSNSKGTFSEKHTPLDTSTVFQAAEPTSQQDQHSNSKYASVTEASKSDIPQSSVPSIDPVELLPKDENSEWNKLNPTSSSNIGNVNLITPSPQNFLSANQPLRNANMQLRSDPPVPQIPVSPWNNTTIGPDESRLPLSIGCKA